MYTNAYVCVCLLYWLLVCMFVILVCVCAVAVNVNIDFNIATKYLKTNIYNFDEFYQKWGICVFYSFKLIIYNGNHVLINTLLAF